jgi:hypothetical protein
MTNQTNAATSTPRPRGGAQKGLVRNGLAVALLVAVGVLAAPETALAINEFKREFIKKYAGENAPAEFKGVVEAAGCNICHIRGQNKRERNEYGMALSKFLKVVDFQGPNKKFAGGEAEKIIADALGKAEMDKSKSGATFGEVIKQGKLPAAAQ